MHYYLGLPLYVCSKSLPQSLLCPPVHTKEARGCFWLPVAALARACVKDSTQVQASVKSK